MRDRERRRPPRRKAGVGRKREVPFARADDWAARQQASRWERITVRDGEKGPLTVDAMSVRVRTKQGGRVGPEERLVVIRPAGESRIDYALSNADPKTPLTEIVRAQRQRHRIEEVFGAGKGEVGLNHYKVRSWVGWHHHMTLSLITLWFLCLERRHVGGKTPAMTVPQMRHILVRLLGDHLPSLEKIAAVVSRVLRRNEESRIYHWHKATGEFPPRRAKCDTG